MHDVVVIGAGMAGLICARQLVRAGLDVLVLEKSPGLGGRMATRRIPREGYDKPLLVDHGAQYFTADTDSFHRLIREMIALGLVVEWTRTLYVLDSEGLHPDTLDTQQPRYVCPEGMTALAKYLAEPLNVITDTRVVKIDLRNDTWLAMTENGPTYTATSLVMAMPAPQVLSLLTPVVPKSSALYPPLYSARYVSCLAVLAGYPDQTPMPEWKGIRCVQDPLLAWVALDSSKRLQPAPPVLVLHTTPEFSENHLDDDKETTMQIGVQLLKHAAQRLDPWIQKPAWMQVHRWRYSLPVETVGLASLAARISPKDAPESAGGLPLVCAGDWCGGSKVEGAWVSGHDAAERLLTMLGISVMPSRFMPAQS